MQDTHGRTLDHLRISVTDRCNMRCSYCMPDGDYGAQPRANLLTFEEITTVVGKLVRDFGVRQLRLTGGEPLVRRDLPKLIAKLRALPVAEIAMTTNAVLLKGKAQALRAAGLDRLNISLDTLQQDRLNRISPGTRLKDILNGIDAALAAGFTGLKFNAVLMRGTNDDEILPLIDYAIERGGVMRFIEAMPIGVLAGRHQEILVPAETIRQTVAAKYAWSAAPRPAGSPAANYTLRPKSAPAHAEPIGEFGIIASETEPFCMQCRRLRLTADGTFIACLFREHGADLRQWVRSQHASPAAADQAFADLLTKAVALKPTARLPMVKHAMVVVGG